MLQTGAWNTSCVVFQYYQMYNYVTFSFKLLLHQNFTETSHVIVLISSVIILGCSSVCRASKLSAGIAISGVLSGAKCQDGARPTLDRDCICAKEVIISWIF